MSKYVYVIDELDFTNQIIVAPTTNAALESIYNDKLLKNNTPPAVVWTPMIVPVALTTAPSAHNKIISGAKELEFSEQARSRNSREGIVLARKIIDLAQLTEKKKSISREIKVWPQFRWHCFLCLHSCNYYKVLLNHLKHCHNILTEDDVRYHCSDCGRVIQEYCQFINHVRQEHHPHLKRNCDVCSRSYETYETLARHRETAHAEHANLRPIVFNCTQCELTFATKDEVNCHIAHHIWVCQMLNSDGTLCLREFDKPNELFQHKIKHVIHKKVANSKNYLNGFTCDCSKKFVSRKDLWAHLSIHATELPHKCYICPARFKTQKECIIHTQCHQHFLCKYCPKILLTDRQYNSHMKIHISPTNSKKTRHIATCRRCGIKFESQIAITKHTKLSCLRRSLSCGIPMKTNKQPSI